jgi:hypothetical protein
MATIPDVDRERVTLRPSMDVARHEAGIIGRGLEAVGRGITSFGADVAAMAAKERRRLEEAQADEAINKLRQKQIELTVGQADPKTGGQAGYALTLGAKVVNPSPTGVSFLDQHRQRFTSEKEVIGKTLSGAALDRFNAFAANADIEFQSGLMRHALKESDSFYKQTYDSTLKSEALNAGANWNNPDAVVESLRRVSEATLREADRVGDVDEVTAQQEALAGVHASVVDGALTAGEAKFAEKYLSDIKEALPAKTALALNDKVQSVRKQQIALEAADKVARRVAPLLMPSEYDRAEAFASGSDTPGDWKVPAHALKDAAALAKLPADAKLAEGSKEYNATLGKAYFGSLMKKYGGDTEKAWAAYHAGPKVVAEAEAQAAKSWEVNKKDPRVPVKGWLDLVPKETQDRVIGNRKMFKTGAGVVEPTLAEVKDLTRRQVLRDNPQATGEQVEAAQVKAEQWFTDLRASRNQTQDNALLDVQQRVDAGKIKSVHDLTPQDMALLGSKRTSARAYIEGAQGDLDKMVSASPAAREQYDRLMSAPDILKDYDAATIMSLTPELGQKWVNDLLSRKQDYLTNPERFAAARVDADLFNTAIDPYMTGVSKSGAALFKSQVRDKAEAEIGAMRAQGKVPTDREKRDIIGKYAMRYPVEKPGMLWGTNIEQVPGALLPSAEQPLPAAEADKIRAKAAKLGMPNLSDSDILRVYRMQKAAEAAK